MPTLAIIKDLHVLEQAGLGLFSGVVIAMHHQFSLECMEDNPDLSDEELLDAMQAHPILINRPLVQPPAPPTVSTYPPCILRLYGSLHAVSPFHAIIVIEAACIALFCILPAIQALICFI